MKKLITIILVLATSVLSAQVANYKANSLNLLQSYQDGEISKESYIDIAKMQIEKLRDSVQVVPQKPRYNATIDLSLLAGGVLYQKFGNNVKYDYILHSWGGYFATKAMIYGLDRMGMSKTACILIPFVTTSAMCLLKEYVIDASPSKGDLYAGIGGAGLAVVGYSIDIEKPFKKHRK